MHILLACFMYFDFFSLKDYVIMNTGTDFSNGNTV